MDCKTSSSGTDFGQYQTPTGIEVLLSRVVA